MNRINRLIWYFRTYRFDLHLLTYVSSYGKLDVKTGDDVSVKLLKLGNVGKI